MKLIELELSHFKGIKYFKFTPDGKPASIYGANETGKTTIGDAFTWLLFGKDMMGRSEQSFKIKYSPGGETLHDVDYSVKGIFEIGGDKLVLEKAYQENWVRSRGERNRHLDGHNTVYHVNGKPVSMTEYKQRVESIISYDRFMMLTLPDYFAEKMHWQARREILFELAGDITVDDIIKSDEKLKRIPEILNGDDPEDVKVSLNRNRRDVEDELKNKIPTRIDEMERSVEEVPDAGEVEKKIEKLEAKRESVREKRLSSKDDRIQRLKNQLQDLDIKKSSRKNELENSKYADKIPDLRSHVQKLENELDDFNRQLREKKNRISRYPISEIERKINNRKGLLQAHREETPDEYREPGDCYACGQPLPKDQIVEAREKYEKYVEQFNRDKAKEIKQLQAELKELEAQKIEAASNVDAVNKEIADMESDRAEMLAKIEDARKELKAAMEEKPDVLGDEKYLELIEQERTLNDELKKIEVAESVERKQIESEISEITAKIKKEMEVMATINSQKKVRDRLKKLNQEQEKMGEALEQIEDDLWTIDLFIRSKAEYVTDRVNALFQKVEWKLFKELLGGGVEPTCEALYKGIGFSEGLNNAGRVQAGIDIIRTLTLHFGVEPPVFIDNHESISEINPGSIQVISLYFDPKEPELKVVYE